MSTTESEPHTVAALAVATGMSRYSIWRLIRQGHIRAIRVGSRTIRIPPSEWDRLVHGVSGDDAA